MLLDDMADKFPGLAGELAARPHVQRERPPVAHDQLERGTRVMIFPRTPVLGEALRGWKDQETIVHLMSRFSFLDVRMAASQAAREASRAVAVLPAAPVRPAPVRRQAPVPPAPAVRLTAPQPAVLPDGPPTVQLRYDRPVPVFIPKGEEDPDLGFWGEEAPEPRRWLRRRSRAAS